MVNTGFSKRLTSLLVLLCMSLGILSGCVAQPQNTIPTEDPTVSTTLPSRADGSARPDSLNQKLTEKQRLTPIANRAPSQGQSKWNTVMVYMVGSDLESSYGAASADILEMLNAGLSTEHTNLVIYTGGANSWELNISSSYNSVFALDATGQNLNLVGSTEQSVNTGDPAALSDFLWYAYENYPALNYDLILWDHGGGPLYGYGSDELFDYDGLTLWELDEALASSPFAETKLGYLGFDACLMASIETAVVVSPYTRYLVASEEVEDGNGWDYSFLSVYNDVTVPGTTAKAILKSYETSMQNLRYQPEYTLSCMNLSYISITQYGMSRVFEKMSEDVISGGYHTIAKYRDQTKRFAMGSVSSLSSSYDLVDLGSLAAIVKSAYSREALSLENALDKLILAQVSNVPGASGVSMYFPYDNRDLYRNGGSELTYYYLDNFMDCLGYRNFLDTFGAQWISGRKDNLWQGNRANRIEKPGQEQESIYLQIDPQALETLSTASYTLLQYNPERDTYYEVLMDCQVQPDENGLVAIPRDPSVFLLASDLSDCLGDLGEPLPIPATQISSDGASQNYICNRAMLMTSNALIVGDTTPVQIVFTLDTETNTSRILNILSRNEDADFYGKMDVDISRYNLVGFQMAGLYPSYDTDGSLFPAGKWQEDSMFSVAYQGYRNEIRLDPVPISQVEGDFYCQLTLKDTFGNVIGGELFSLKQTEQAKQVSLDTTAGKLHFAVYSDHAEVVDLENTPYDLLSGEPRAELVIPAQVDGVPVTVIGPSALYYSSNLARVVIPDSVTTIDYDAFSACYYLTEVVLPEGLQYIGTDAFSFTALTSLNLPESVKVLDTQAFAGTEMDTVTIGPNVEYIGDGAFSHCVNLRSIQVNRNNPNYKSLDGVLFNADGSILVAYPGGRGTAYQVPQGTKEISIAAFMGTELLTEVTFPETLKVIGNQAFCSSPGLTDIQLPQSLEVIGAAAFGTEIGVDTSSQVRTIAIGPNVRWIGQAAFEGYRMEAFTVDRRNTHYSAVNGCLLNASGTRLIQVPYNFQGVLAVPEGVSFICSESLFGCDGITELIFPDSVTSISLSSGLPKNLQKLTVGSGMCNWNGLEDYAIIPELILSPENPFFIMKDDCIYSADGTQLLLCRVQEGELTIPEGTTSIDPGAFGNTGDLAITQVHLPASLESIPSNLFIQLKQLQTITVAEGNSAFAAWDGLLYSADGQTLVACPLGITGTITVRPGTQVIGANAFGAGYTLQAEELFLPEGVVAVRSGNLSSANYSVVLKLHLPASLTDIYPGMLGSVTPGKMEIYAPAGSYAASYAASLGHEVKH